MRRAHRLILAGGFCLLVVGGALCAAHQRHAVRAVLGGAVCGIAALAVVALLSPYTGVTLPLNPFTGFVAAVLGLPGVVGVLLLQLLL